MGEGRKREREGERERERKREREREREREEGRGEKGNAFIAIFFNVILALKGSCDPKTMSKSWQQILKCCDKLSLSLSPSQTFPDLQSVSKNNCFSVRSQSEERRLIFVCAGMSLAARSTKLILANRIRHL